MTTSKVATIVAKKMGESVKSGVKLNAGEVILDRTMAIVKPRLPLMARGYADTAIGRAVVAAIISGVVIKFAPDKKVAVQAAEAMMDEAGVELVNQFEIPAMVNDWLDSLSDIEFPEPEQNQDAEDVARAK